MNCNDINDAIVLKEYFRSNNESVINEVFTCFHKIFFKEFLHFSRKTILQNRSLARVEDEELVRDAFNDGLLSFYSHIRAKNFEERGATIKTFFFAFCKRKLFGLLRPVTAETARTYAGDPDLKINSAENADGYNLEEILYNEERKEKEVDTLIRALKQIGERCSNLLWWRKYYKLSNEEIAGRTGLAPDTVNNEVYKCSIRIKKIITDMDNNLKV